MQQLDFISEQFYIVEVRIDNENNHEVIINEEKTRIFLPLSIRNNQLALEQIRKEIYNYIEGMIADNEKQSAYILLSLEDRGGAYKYAFDLIWNVFREIEETETTTRVHKMQYIYY